VGTPLPEDPGRHPFLRSPHRTFFSLSLPVLLSLVAEPLTGLADTAFVSRLGAAPLAALGVGTVVLSSVFWMFNFLGIGTQTEVARSVGAGDGSRACEINGLALALSALFGLGWLVVGMLGADMAAAGMGASGEVHQSATLYLRIRLLAAPAVLVTTAAFGTLRGLQDMRTPLRIAVTINVLNIVLDGVLIFGMGPVPAFGIAGAAWATVAAQTLGGLWALMAVRARLGLPARVHGRDARRLLVVGRDLFLRTGLLTLFLLLTTRAATRIGAEAGAAHQAIRQVWLFTALLLDAFAATAQSLVGYFRGAGRLPVMRRVAFIACAWSLGTGVLLGLAMWLGQAAVARWLVPTAAQPVFFAAWLVAAAMMPINALSFATDGIHWGTSDYRFLRNAMLLATALGTGGLLFLGSGPGALTLVWVVTAGWVLVRAVLGVARIWPGIGASPFVF
jgi:MATE family multidrug resistance protein